jgi:hypothetical protein
MTTVDFVAREGSAAGGVTTEGDAVFRLGGADGPTDE